MTRFSISRDELIALTVHFAEIDSTNPTLVPGASGERAVGQAVADWMTAKGWDVRVDWPAPDRPNVIGVIKGNGGAPLLINAHLDTVGSTEAAKLVHVEEDRIRGRGVLDTKGGLAAALLAAESVASLPPAGDIIFAAVCDEEADSIGTEHLLASTTAAGAIVIEPTGLQVVAAHRGFAVIECTFHGRASHTAQPEDGINAITPAIEFAQAVANYATQLADLDTNGLFGNPTVEVTKIAGGSELFTIPDRCTVIVELRAETLSAVIAAVDGLLGQARTRGYHVESRQVIVREPLPDNSNQSVTALLADALTRLGNPPGIVGAPYWTDAALVSAQNIPVAVFGPGGHGIHSDDEWVSIDDLVISSAALAEVMAEFGNTFPHGFPRPV